MIAEDEQKLRFMPILLPLQSKNLGKILLNMLNYGIMIVVNVHPQRPFCVFAWHALSLTVKFCPERVHYCF